MKFHPFEHHETSLKTYLCKFPSLWTLKLIPLFDPCEADISEAHLHLFYRIISDFVWAQVLYSAFIILCWFVQSTLR